MVADTNIATKTIYVLVGLPFAGKTTYVKRLADVDTLIIERDAFLEEINRDPELMTKLERAAHAVTAPASRLSPDPFKNAMNDVVTGEYVRRVIEMITQSPAGKIVVDGTHLQTLSRSFVKAFPHARRIAVVFPPDPELSVERMQQETLVGVRTTLTPELIRRMGEVFEMPTLNEGFDEIQKTRELS